MITMEYKERTISLYVNIIISVCNKQETIKTMFIN